MHLTPEIVQHTFSEEIYRLPNRVLVLIASEWNELSDEEKQLLRKILNAVNLSVDSVQIHSREEIDINSTALKPSSILSFGTRILPSVTPYEAAEVTGIPVIAADTLKNLTDEKKKLLWIALRKVYKHS